MSKTKKQLDKLSSEIRKLLEQEKLVIGTERTVKLIRNGRIGRVFVSSNCPDGIKERLEHYRKTKKFEIEYSDKANEEFGVICRKSFSVSVIGVLR